MWSEKPKDYKIINMHRPVLCALERDYLWVDRHLIHQALASIHPMRKIVISQYNERDMNMKNIYSIIWNLLLA